MEKNETKPGAMAAAKKAPPKKTGRQIPYAGKIHDVLTDGTTQPAQKVAVEEITQEQTGAIDLHLKGPEDVEAIITREVEKLNDGFHVVIFNPEQNKLKPRQKIDLLKDLVMGKPNAEGERSGGFTIADENDEAGYKKLDDTRKMLVKLRTGVSNKHKLLKENYLKVGRALDGEKNELTNLLTPIENYCEIQLKVIDDIKAEKQRELDRQKELKKEARIKEIKENGMTFDGSFYSIGEHISLDIVTLENLNQDQYDGLLARVALENKKIKFAAYKAEQRQRVERYLFERKQRKQAAEAQRLQELANQQRNDRKADRVDILTMLGFTEHASKQYYQLTNAAGSVIITINDLETLEGEQWRARFISVKGEIEELNNKLIEKQAEDLKKDRNLARYGIMQTAGYNFDSKTKMFYIRTKEYGDTNFFTEAEIYSDEIKDFTKFFEEGPRAAADKTIMDSKKLQEQKTAKEQRTKNRVAELVNGFGMSYTDGVSYIPAPSKYAKEPELKDLNGLLDILVTSVEDFEEQEWSAAIDGLTVILNNTKQAETAAKERLENEAETARVALMSERDQVVEYISKLEAVNVAFTLKDTALINIVNYIFASFKECRRKLEEIEIK